MDTIPAEILSEIMEWVPRVWHSRILAVSRLWCTEVTKLVTTLRTKDQIFTAYGECDTLSILWSLDKKNHDYHSGLLEAAKNGHERFVDFMIGKGVGTHSLAFKGACAGGFVTRSSALMDLLRQSLESVPKRKLNFRRYVIDGLLTAYRNGHEPVVKHLMSKLLPGEERKEISNTLYGVLSIR